MANTAVVSMATRQQVMLERLKAGNTKQLETYLKQAADAIRAQLARAELTEFSRARLDAQLSAISAQLKTIYGQAAEQIHNDLKDYAQYAGGAEARAFEAMVAPGVRVAAPPAAQIYVAAYARPLGSGKLATMMRPFVDRWATGSVERVENAMRLGYFQGKTNRQLTNEIVGTAKGRYLDGLIAASQRDAEAVVRTTMQHMATSARDAFIGANADIVSGVEWVSTLDSRTTIQCQALDGQVFPVDAGPRPPLHVNCRSTVVPVLANKYLRETLRQGATRSSADGLVSAGLSYYDWLKRQPAAFQDIAVGPTRAKLLRDGGLTSERFAELQLHKDFTPATLEEMRRLEPVAFDRAGL